MDAAARALVLSLVAVSGMAAAFVPAAPPCEGPACLAWSWTPEGADGARSHFRPGPWILPWADDLVVVTHDAEAPFWEGFEVQRLAGADGSVRWRTPLDDADDVWGLWVRDVAFDVAVGEAVIVGTRLDAFNSPHAHILRVELASGAVVDDRPLPMPGPSEVHDLYLGPVSADGLALVLGGLAWSPPLSGSDTFLMVFDLRESAVRAWIALGSRDARLSGPARSAGEPPSVLVESTLPGDRVFLVLLADSYQTDPDANVRVAAVPLLDPHAMRIEWIEEEHVVVERGLRIHRVPRGFVTGPEGRALLWGEGSVQPVTCAPVTPPTSVAWPACNVQPTTYVEVLDAGGSRRDGHLLVAAPAGHVGAPWDLRPHAAVAGARPGEMLVAVGAGLGAALVAFDAASGECTGVASIPHGAEHVDEPGFPGNAGVTLAYDAVSDLAMAVSRPADAAGRPLLTAVAVEARAVRAAALLPPVADEVGEVAWTEPLRMSGDLVLVAHAQGPIGAPLARVDAVVLDRDVGEPPRAFACVRVPARL